MTINEALAVRSAKRLEAIKKAEEQTALLHKEIKGLSEIDAELSAVSDKLFKAAMRGDYEQAFSEIRAENELLQEKRAKLLAENGKSPNCDSPVFECSECSDSGYVGFKLCSCIHKALAVARYKESGLGNALYDKTFDNFSLKYYSSDEQCLDNMRKVTKNCRDFAKSFNGNGSGLIFIGGTGLGKTHIAAAIARVVTERGYSVIYESAQNLFDAFDTVRFGKSDKSELERCLYCDLLIIDDLGAESGSQYTVASFGNLINERLISGKPIIVTTNLTPAMLKKNYGERVYSRLLGENGVLKFTGKDIRLQKVSEL